MGLTSYGAASVVSGDPRQGDGGGGGLGDRETGLVRWDWGKTLQA